MRFYGFHPSIRQTMKLPLQGYQCSRSHISFYAESTSTNVKRCIYISVVNVPAVAFKSLCISFPQTTTTRQSCEVLSLFPRYILFFADNNAVHPNVKTVGLSCCLPCKSLRLFQRFTHNADVSLFGVCFFNRDCVINVFSVNTCD